MTRSATAGALSRCCIKAGEPAAPLAVDFLLGEARTESHAGQSDLNALANFILSDRTATIDEALVGFPVSSPSLLKKKTDPERGKELIWNDPVN